MEEALRQIACTSSAGMDTQRRYSAGLGFVNKQSHEHQHHGGFVEMKKKEKVGSIKKKLKLLKGLSKDLSTFSQMGFAVDQDQNLLAQVRGKMISEAAEVLMKQLEQLKTEEKKLKRKRKQEKANKLKAKIQSSACESSDSSDSECEEEEVVQMIDGTQVEDGLLNLMPVIRSEESSPSPNVVGTDDGMTKRVEVCMGNKCKKSGGGALFEEFQRAMGAEGDVVACKCMGKCRDGPNVRLFHSDAYHHLTPPNPLCIGVALEDVGAIVGNLFTQGSKSLELGLR
ncbi:hypothetical protein CISIN_1g023360mg [Citrus sinensis]|uniref:Diacylglycerol acyltransferase n=1 Tax=Citrus sinensis TaxID=2711 RepID=A0A067G9T2_CITSI|nr:hypothetical protein CISIN_1g023360mg [Citrus sinensis]